MTLLSGTRLGAYEIVGALGAGGMGEVYRARDTKLGREVAIKILPESVLHDPERIARFQREAQLLAALNHPHIAAIHGLEEADGNQFLVLELVEGDTLAERIARRHVGRTLSGSPGEPDKARPTGLPVAEALAIARQVADALLAAHEKGIIHRDLKPANIALTTDGQVKVLDFGLAKALGPAGGGNVVDSPALVTHSPTLSLAATQAGVILGTAAYMAPEQAKGRPADKRSDIWAFGCVLYEMLTGKRPFEGEDVSDTMAAVLMREPDWTLLPAAVPVQIRTLLEGCLQKDRRQRFADMSLAQFLMSERGLTMPSVIAGATAHDATRPSLWRRMLLPATALIVGAALAAAGVLLAMRPAPPRLERFVITATSAAPLTVSPNSPDLAISPDGTRIVYTSGNPARLHVRSIDQLDSTALPGTDNAQNPFFSPDGNWIAYSASGVLRKVAVLGGSPVTLASVGGINGGSWGPDDIIVANLAGILLRVPAAGGEPVQLPVAVGGQQRIRRWPEILPGGKAVLLTSGPFGQLAITLLDLETLEERPLISGGSNAHYSPTGHILYGVDGTLRAVRFNLDRLEVTGDPVPVLEGVMTKGQGAVNFSVAPDGSLVYVAGGAGIDAQQMVVSVDRQGRGSALPGIPLNAYRDVRVSPDGTRLAVATQDDVWTYDVSRATLSRLTTHAASDRSPLWTPDGQRIIFTSAREGYQEMFWRPADGTGTDERLLARAKDLIDLRASGWSTDGRQLLFTEVSPTVQCAIGQIAIERPSDAKVLVKGEFCNDRAAVSPDGRWMAYTSNVSGRYEVYVERYPELGNRQQISTGGGLLPIWSRGGRELFFSSLDSRQMLAVPVQTGTTLVAGRPQVLFEGAMLPVQAGFWPYDIAPDGRFVIIRSGQSEAGGATAPNVILARNWFEELKRLVPVN